MFSLNSVTVKRMSGFFLQPFCAAALADSASQLHKTRGERSKCSLIVLVWTKQRRMAAAILLQEQLNAVSRSAQTEKQGENKRHNLTSVPVSIVEQTLALYYIMLQRSRPGASANILSFRRKLGCPKSACMLVLLLVMFYPLGPFPEIWFVGVSLSVQVALWRKVWLIKHLLIWI